MFFLPHFQNKLEIENKIDLSKLDKFYPLDLESLCGFPNVSSEIKTLIKIIKCLKPKWFWLYCLNGALLNFDWL